MNRYLSLMIGFCVMVLSSCNDDIKTTTFKIDSMTDSTLVAKIDGRNITFDIKNAKFDNGFVMPDDSVVVHYVGDMREGKVMAALIRLVPKMGNIVDAVYDPSKELKTIPMSEEEKKAFDRGIEYARRLKK